MLILLPGNYTSARGLVGQWKTPKLTPTSWNRARDLMIARPTLYLTASCDLHYLKLEIPMIHTRLDVGPESAE